MQPSVSLICLESKTGGRSLQLQLLSLNVFAASPIWKAHIHIYMIHTSTRFGIISPWSLMCRRACQNDATTVKTNQHTRSLHLYFASPVCLFCLCFLCPYIVWICAWKEYDKTGLAGADGTDWVWKLGTRKCTYIAIASWYLVAVSGLICKFIQWKQIERKCDHHFSDNCSWFVFISVIKSLRVKCKKLIRLSKHILKRKKYKLHTTVKEVK